MSQMRKVKLPRLMIAAPHGRSGKSMVSLGLLGAWKRRGKQVVPFKKGPDFIDSAWSTAASGIDCRNLDLFLMQEQQVRQRFNYYAAQGDLSLLEGNMGLYDGMDMIGSGSTAQMAKLLKAPVILVLDVTRMTRSAAASVLGMLHFDPELKIGGIVLNKVAGSRQESLIRSCINHYCGVPVLGAVPKVREGLLEERHLGLVPPVENPQAIPRLEFVADMVEKYVDMAALEKLAATAPPINVHGGACADIEQSVSLKIGVIRDKAFHFYYPDNLEALQRAGAELIWLNALDDSALPEIDGLYIGGGFPEAHAEQLANNKSFRVSVKAAAEVGMPMYAECGGLVYLGKDLYVEGKRYPMAGVFPVDFEMKAKPQGHGYMELEVSKTNPYFTLGMSLRGHEFHYSRPILKGKVDINHVFNVRRGHGFSNEKDGLLYKNVFASYAHFHAATWSGWADNLIKAANQYRRKKVFANQLPWDNNKDYADILGIYSLKA